MSRKEIEELQTLLKALDIRLKNDEITEHEYETIKMKYQAQLEEQMAVVKENSFLKDLSYVSISGSGKVTDSYVSISGSGRVEGWRGGSISISGSGKITDDEIKISGSGSLPGDMVTQKLKVSGALKVGGALETEQLMSSGSLKIEGPLTVTEKLSISGSGKIEGDINAHGAMVSTSGALKAEGNLACNEAEMNGSYTIEGNVDCSGSFRSELSGKSRIEGHLSADGDVYIEQDRSSASLKVESIYAKGKVYLEGVKAQLVQGTSVELGPDCVIEKVEEKG
ncbi:MAG: polymer-forming cytoskeletal protein [Candidatus Heimdallarchaeota archaeon]